MNGTQALSKIREEIAVYVDDPDLWEGSNAPDMLADHVMALDHWMTSGGALPAQWGSHKTKGRPRREGDGPVVLEDKAHGTRSTYNKGCRCKDCTKANREAGARARAAKGARHANA